MNNRPSINLGSVGQTHSIRMMTVPMGDKILHHAAKYVMECMKCTRPPVNLSTMTMGGEWGVDV